MQTIAEEPIKYGENGRGIAIATIPSDINIEQPALVIFNAGLLHRSEPFRLNVQIARRSSKLGHICVRFDMSGKGDTPARDGLTNRESVEQDWKALKQSLENRFGCKNYILMGLCSGADNAIKTAFYDQDIVGLILLDPRIPSEPGHTLRNIKHKLGNIETWKRSPGIVFRFLKRLFFRVEKESTVSIDQVRDLPSTEELNSTCRRFARDNFLLMAVFTNFSLPYYNSEGQFERLLGLLNESDSIEEYWWPQVDHVFSVAEHRDLLAETIETSLTQYKSG